MVIVLTIVAALIVFGVLIMIHELGHFAAARAFGVTVEEFSIGMGPLLLSRCSAKSGTQYSLRAFPIGGFVRMKGEDDDSGEEGSLCSKPVWQRMIVDAAGAAMNLLLGLILTFVFVITSARLGTNILTGFQSGGEGQPEIASLEAAGARVGDAIVSISGNQVRSSTEIIYEIMRTDGHGVEVAVMRDGEKLLLKNVVFPTEYDEESKTYYGYPDFYLKPEPLNAGTVLKQTFYQMRGSVRLIWGSFVDLFRGRYGIEAVSGPVGITKAIGTAVNSGWHTFLYLCAIMTVNLGVVNLLPLPALDGCRILFLLIELVFRKPIKKELEGKIHLVGIILLFVLMIVISLKDLFALF